MAKTFTNPVKNAMFRIIFYQLLIILGFTLSIFLLKGMQSSLSAFAGSMPYWLPTVIFIWRVSAYADPRAGTRFLAAFILGEGIKLLLCGVLFVLFIKYFHVQLIDAVIGLAGAIAAFWLASATLLLKTGAK